MKLNSLKKFLSITEVNRTGMILIMTLVIYAINPFFYTAANLRSIVIWGAIFSLMILGQMLYLIAGALDLSFGGVVCISNVLMGALVIWWGFDIWLAVLIVLGIGATTGLAIASFGNTFSPPLRFMLPVFIFTIVLMFVFTGMGKLISGGFSIYGFPDAYSLIAKAELGPLPIIPIYLLIIAGVFVYIFYFRPLGWQLFATGLNDEVARKMGINVKKVRLIAFTTGSLIQAFVGIILSSYMAIGSPLVGPGYLLPVIAGAFIGGISLAGGEGSPFGAIIGGFAVYLIQNIIIVLAISVFWTEIVTGLFLVLFISYDFYQKRRRFH